MIRKMKFQAAMITSFLTASVFIIRAALTGITYDEAFTYLVYAKPLMDSPTISTVQSIFWGSVANNHWLNTFFIALTCGALNIQFNEFLIRLPSIAMGCVYLGLVLWEFCRGRLNGIQYAVLTFCYYAAEFFGLARGYGMAATLVLGGILLYDRWREEKFEKHFLLLLSVGLFLLSAYANSVTLVCCFCLGIVMAGHLILERKLLSFLRKCWPVLLVYAGAGLVIVKYHFRVSGEGMPLWASSESGIYGIVAEYVSMLLKGDMAIRAASFFLLIFTVAAAAYLALRKKLLECDLGIACLIYFLVLISMDAVFKRGGFYGRTLLPAYPLVALGIYELLGAAVRDLQETFHGLTGKLHFAGQILGTLFVLTLFFMYVGKINLLRTRDWYDDYNIKIDFYCNPDFFSAGEHASVVFYQEKKAWDKDHLFQEYLGEENNSCRFN